MAEPASKGKIIQSAWTLLSQVGVDQFSMRKLAKEVGITASTLYWHFPNKDAIFAEMVDEVCAEALGAFKVESSWQTQLVSDGMVFAKKLRERPFSAELLFITPPTTEHFWRVNEQFLKTVDGLTLADSEKFTIISIYLDFILTFERDRQLHQQNADLRGKNQQPPATNLPANIPILTRMYQQGDFNQMDRDSTLEWSLTTLVKGFEQRQQETE